jgi:hypothetical protein
MSQAASVLLTAMEIIYWRVLEIGLYVSSNISSVMAPSHPLPVGKNLYIPRYTVVIAVVWEMAVLRGIFGPVAVKWICRIKTNIQRLCGLAVRIFGYKSIGPGFDPRRYQIF